MSGQILAALIVKHGTIVSKSSKDVNFDAATGLVTFANAGGLNATPVVSYISPNATYATEHVYFKELGNTSVTVWQGPLDTGNRNHPPSDFTLIVVGF
jgi:hypothetical protein